MHGWLFCFKISRLVCTHFPEVAPHSVEQCVVCQVKVSNSTEGLGQSTCLLALVRHGAASSVNSAFPHHNLQLWIESWLSTILISVHLGYGMA